ncbi:flagellar hook basal-body protein [Gemmata sp. G18]|uniref:Flagellar hook basal-body protein n=1 Tax=Gemmata palustris TaxID=2822762 RepID=A0ABS5BSX0_9BACT|nr:flagellar hook basal-body protein [Gemmata palustris]MBP3956829.1 flagellar hook basal-body protein [Gemmata palustris]
MIRGMYSAASALVVASEQQEVTAHNLAHATTPGYRERGLVFETFDRALGRATEPTGDITGVRTVQAYNDFRPGALQQTNHPYDLALGDPDRFFVLNGPNGPLYTRNGCFFPTPGGQLVSQGGYALQSENGAVTIPPNANRVVIASDGSITADGQPLGQLRVVRFANPQQLTATGPTLYTAPPGAGLQAAPTQVMQGFREGSNVQPADAMVRLIIGARYYDAAQRALRSLAETIQLNTRPQNS